MLKRIKKIKNVINLCWVKQIEAQGQEVDTFKDEEGNQGGKIKNPIETLKDNGFLTYKECEAGLRYQRTFEITKRTNHARPIMDGSTVSSLAFGARDAMNADWVEACRKVNRIKRVIEDEDIKLICVLESLFEQQKTIDYIMDYWSIGRLKVRDSAQRICEILIEFEKENKKSA